MATATARSPTEEYMKANVTIREFTSKDSIAELTELLHASYKVLADMGLHFVATYQSDDITQSRIANARCFIAEVKEKLVGTITYYPSVSRGGKGFANVSERSGFGQFGVLPEYRGLGVGALLLQQAEAQAIKDGVGEFFLDTAAPATHLIELYQKKGYEIVGNVQWEEVNYPSVIMRKVLNSNLAISLVKENGV